MADLAATSRRTKEDGDLNPLGTDLSVTRVHGIDLNIYEIRCLLSKGVVIVLLQWGFILPSSRVIVFLSDMQQGVNISRLLQ